MSTATASPPTVATYEGMFILDSSKYASGPDAATNDIIGMLTRVGAELLASRPWQDTKLAYPIDGNRKGVYFLTYFTLDTQRLKELERLVKLNELVLRHLILKLDPALVTPMVELATGKRESVTTFKDTEADSAIEGPRRGRFGSGMGR